jgi:hypothetical protein
MCRAGLNSLCLASLSLNSLTLARQNINQVARRATALTEKEGDQSLMH